jgi:hypothetical protein
MKWTWLICLASIVFCFSAAHAAESAEMNDYEKKKAESLIKDLGADEFQTREAAEKGLAALGGNVLAMVKATAASTADAEIRTRCERVIKILALDVEKDPVVLAKMGRDLALAKNYADAAKYYSKAAEIFKEAAAKSDDEKAKADLLTKQKRAADRMARAEMMAKTVSDAGEDGQIMIAGGGAGVRQIVVRANGMVINQPVGSDDNDW